MIQAIKSNSFPKFLLKLLASLFTLFIIDLAGGAILQNFYFKQQSGYDYLTTYAIEKTKTSILILGSSRAKNIYNTTIFENQTGLTCFNTGRDGEPIFYHYAILQAALKRYTPKIVILSFDAGNFSKNTDAYDKISALLPFYKTHPEIRSVTALKSPYEKLKLLSHIYPYNSILLQIIAGNLEYNKEKYITRKGFVPLHNFFSGPLKIFDYTKEKDLDSIKINTYKSFIQNCINHKVELYIICPPYMINPIGIDHSILEGKKIAQQYNIPFLDYSRDTSFTNNQLLFADFRHLNVHGAELLSNNVINKIGKKIK